MKVMMLTKILRLGTALGVSAGLGLGSAMAESQKGVSALQQDWAVVNYQLKGDSQLDAFEVLQDKAQKMLSAAPDSAELLIWQGIIQSSYAGAKGGLGALSLAKSAKESFEKAIEINDKALKGSAYTSLGTLYAKVPGWPIGFGDDDKAKGYLEKALSVNPEGIDSNYFYAEFLFEEGDYADAKAYLVQAKAAAPRPDRPLADEYRHREVDALMNKVEKKIKR